MLSIGITAAWRRAEALYNYAWSRRVQLREGRKALTLSILAPDMELSLRTLAAETGLNADHILSAWNQACEEERQQRAGRLQKAAPWWQCSSGACDAKTDRSHTIRVESP